MQEVFIFLETFLFIKFKGVTNYFLFRDFDVSYLLPRSSSSERPEVYLSLTSDWDLDAAFHTASYPLLQVKVEPFEKLGIKKTKFLDYSIIN